MSEYIVDLAEYRGNVETIQGVKEEIVRCEDCRYCVHFSYIEKKDWCVLRGNNSGVPVYPNCFCAWGERRDDGQ